MAILGLVIVAALSGTDSPLPSSDSIAAGAAPASVTIDQVIDALDAADIPAAQFDLEAGQADRFRRWIYDSVATLENRRLRAEFYARYRSPGDFDEAAFKEFLMVRRDAPVLGIDDLPAGSLAADSLVRLGAHAARRDGRYSDRFARAGPGRTLRDAHGDPVPVDPAMLNVGPLRGLGRDSYAWLALPAAAPTTDPAGLRGAPWNVIAPVVTGDTVLAMGPKYAELYAELATLAALGEEEWAGVAHLFAGGAIAHLVAAASPFNASQFGSYQIHPTVRVGWLERLRGIFGRRRSAPPLTAESAMRATRLRSLGQQLPDLMSWELPAAADAGSATGANGATRYPEDWTERLVLAQARGARDQVAAAFVAVDALISAEARDVPLSEAGSMDAGRWIDIDRPGGSEALAELRAMHTDQVERARAGAQRWLRSWNEVRDPEAEEREIVRRRILGRLVARQLDYLSEADVRRMRYLVEREGEVD